MDVVFVCVEIVCVCYCDVFDLAYVYFDQLLFCVVCVDGLGYVYICESYVVLDQCDDPPSLFVRSVCAYGCVVAYFMCLSLLCDFFSCIVMMSGWVLCTKFLVPRFCF